VNERYIVKTQLEHHLEFHCEQLEKKIEQLEFELATAEQCIGSYREVVSHQQDQICNLKEKLHAIEINRVYSA